VYGINTDRAPRLRVMANDDFDVRTRDLEYDCSNIAFSRSDRQGVQTCSWISKTKEDRPSHCVNNDNSCCCYSYDVTCNTKAGRRGCCLLRASCASVARAASNAEMFLCRFVIRLPPVTMERYSESRSRAKSTNRDNLQVAAGSLETLAWSVR
jgi:hypothetical protein